MVWLADSVAHTRQGGELTMVVSESALDGTGVAGARTGQLARTGSATVWAAIAVFWLIIAIQALVRWVFSPDFGPAPLIGPDRMPTWNLVGLRVFEGLSLALLMGLVWFCVVVPWRRTGRLSLDGKFVIGAMAAFVADAFLNSYTYLFAWNADNVNLGVWTAFLPASSPSTSSSRIWLSA
jgi:hypothetical protein